MVCDEDKVVTQPGPEVRGPKTKQEGEIALLEPTACAKGGISEHGRTQLLGFVAFLQSL